MLFSADFKTEIIHEDEYPEKIRELESILAKYIVSGELSSFDGCTIHYEYYLTENSRASVIIVHGFTEFSRKYRELTWYLMRMGYSVFIYDQRGHGLSGRAVTNPHLTHVDSFNDYVQDLSEFCNRIVIPNSNNMPIYMFSQSMGGAVAGLYLTQSGSKIDRAVFSAPMLCPHTQGFPRIMVKKLIKSDARKNGWKDKFRYASEFSSEVNFDVTSDLSRNRFEHNLRLRINDIRYQNSSSTNRWIYEALSVQEKLLCRPSIKKIKSQVLIISAENDTVVKNRPQRRFAALLPHGKIVELAGAKHNLYNSAEPILEEYVKLILSFFSEK